MQWNIIAETLQSCMTARLLWQQNISVILILRITVAAPTPCSNSALCSRHFLSYDSSFFVVVFELLEIMEQRTTALYADSRLYLQRWNEWWENVLSSFSNWVCLMEMPTWEPACRGCNSLSLLFIQSLFWLLASPSVMMSPKTRFGSGNGKACMVQLYKTRSFPICAAVFSGTYTVS